MKLTSLTLILFCCLSYPKPVCGFDLSFDFGDLNLGEIWGQSKYPEDHNKSIIIYKGQSPLKYKDAFTNQDIDISITDLFELGYNKFSLGNGLIDVTQQVENGVKNALKNVLTGYAEYERRQVTEEILNSNYKSNLQVLKFLLDNKNLTRLSMEIANQSLIDDIHKGFKYIANVLLMLFTMIVILCRLADNNFSSVVSQPLLLFVCLWMLIGGSDYLLNLIMYSFTLFSDAILNVTDKHFLFGSFYNLFDELNYSWERVANNVGYFPAIVLVVINLLAQFLFYFYIGGIILYIVIGKVLSPVWMLAAISNSLRSGSINSFINWIKALFVLVLIPLVYTLIFIISSELYNSNQGINMDFINISLVITSMLFIPILSNLILAKGTGNLDKIIVSKKD